MSFGNIRNGGPCETCGAPLYYDDAGPLHACRKMFDSYEDLETALMYTEHENRKLKAQLQLAEAVCESCNLSSMMKRDRWYFDEDALDAWRKSKEEK